MHDNSLLVSLVSGQAFRFKCNNGIYKGVIKDRVYTLSSDNIDLIYKDEVLRRYFDIDRDYEEIKAYLSATSPILSTAIENVPELRILRQDSIEVLLSFILTSCNNISRISLMIERLSRHFGKPIDEEYFEFPTPQSIAASDEDTLRSLGLGFRAPFFLEAARMIDSDKIRTDEIEGMSDPEAREYLKRIRGIGDKVADCILLFGFNRLNVFPRDVHINRVMKNQFEGRDEKMFYPYAGIAQQFLFFLDLNKKNV